MQLNCLKQSASQSHRAWQRLFSKARDGHLTSPLGTSLLPQVAAAAKSAAEMSVQPGAGATKPAPGQSPSQPEDNSIRFLYEAPRRFQLAALRQRKAAARADVKAEVDVSQEGQPALFFPCKKDSEARFNQLCYDVGLDAGRAVPLALKRRVQREQHYKLPKMASLSIVLCDDTHIRGMNNRFRGKDSATDVLSFEMEDALDYKVRLPVKLLGDLVISLDTAQRQAAERGHSLLDELRILLVHGLLHLCGLDHEKGPEQHQLMAAEEQALLKELGWAGQGLISAVGFESGEEGEVVSEEAANNNNSKNSTTDAVGQGSQGKGGRRKGVDVGSLHQSSDQGFLWSAMAGSADSGTSSSKKGSSSSSSRSNSRGGASQVSSKAVQEHTSTQQARAADGSKQQAFTAGKGFGSSNVHGSKSSSSSTAAAAAAAAGAPQSSSSRQPAVAGIPSSTRKAAMGAAGSAMQSSPPRRPQVKACSIMPVELHTQEECQSSSSSSSSSSSNSCTGMNGSSSYGGSRSSAPVVRPSVSIAASSNSSSSRHLGLRVSATTQSRPHSSLQGRSVGIPAQQLRRASMASCLATGSASYTTDVLVSSERRAFRTSGVRLVALDMDGTLLDSKSKMRPSSIKAIKVALALGVQVMVATGKARPAALRAAGLVGLAGDGLLVAESGPGIFLQGLAVHGLDGAQLSDSCLPAAVVEAAARYSLQHKCSMATFHGDTCSTLQMTPDVEFLHHTYYEPLAEVLPSVEALLSGPPVRKLLFISSAEVAAKQIVPHWEAALLGQGADIMMAVPTCVEVVPSGVNKWVGAQVLLAHMDIPLDSFMAVGDGGNDLQLVTHAGVGVAMGNAVPSVKAAAKGVVSSNDEDGIAEAFERFVF